MASLSTTTNASYALGGFIYCRKSRLAPGFLATNGALMTIPKEYCRRGLQQRKKAHKPRLVLKRTVRKRSRIKMVTIYLSVIVSFV